MEQRCAEINKKLEEAQELLSKLNEGLYFQIEKVQTSIEESKGHLLYLHYLLGIKEMMEQNKYVPDNLTYGGRVIRIDDINQTIIIQQKGTSGYIEVSYEDFFKNYINLSEAF